MLIDEWKKAHKFLSVQVTTITGVLAMAYEYIPQIQQYFPPGWFKYAVGAILIARLLRQQKKEENGHNITDSGTS
jgi:hypothetical protein